MSTLPLPPREGAWQDIERGEDPDERAQTWDGRASSSTVVSHQGYSPSPIGVPGPKVPKETETAKHSLSSAIPSLLPQAPKTNDWRHISRTAILLEHEAETTNKKDGQKPEMLRPVPPKGPLWGCNIRPWHWHEARICCDGGWFKVYQQQFPQESLNSPSTRRWSGGVWPDASFVGWESALIESSPPISRASS